MNSKTKQNQTKEKLKKQAHKYHTGVTDEFNQFKRCTIDTQEFTKWPVDDWAPSHTMRSSNISHFII